MTKPTSDKRQLFEVVTDNGMLPLFKMISQTFGKLNGALVVNETTTEEIARYGRTTPIGKGVNPASGYHK